MRDVFGTYAGDAAAHAVKSLVTLSQDRAEFAPLLGRFAVSVQPAT